jgi:hypothetical protein
MGFLAGVVKHLMDDDKPRNTRRQYPSPSKAYDKLKAGDKIHHCLHGNGTIKSMKFFPDFKVMAEVEFGDKVLSIWLEDRELGL